MKRPPFGGGNVEAHSRYSRRSDWRLHPHVAAVKLLRDGFPSAQIEILGYKRIVALAENRFYANATRSIDYGPLSSFFARDSELAAGLLTTSVILI